MRWIVKPPPNDGDERVKERFLLLPKVLRSERFGSQEEVRWLERARYRQIFLGYWYSYNWED